MKVRRRLAHGIGVYVPYGLTSQWNADFPGRFGAPTNPFGTYVSLDGVHPRDAAHVLIADLMITAVNTKYGTSIPSY